MIWLLYIETQRAKEDDDNKLRDAVSGIQYTYDLDLLMYTKSVDGTIIRSDTEALMQDLIREYMGIDVSSMLNMRDQSGMPDVSQMGSMMPGGMVSRNLWQEMLPGDNGKLISPLLEKQYDVIYGSWPTEYGEIVLVVDENNELDDMTLYALGLKLEDDIDAIMDAAINHTDLPADTQK